MGFHEVSFPDCIAMGARALPSFNTTKVELPDSGAQYRTARRSTAKRTFDLSTAVRTDSDFAELLDFYMARLGGLNGFRFKDYSDWSTASDHVSSPDDEDVVLGTGDASETNFQLKKRYSSGGYNHDRLISKPISGTTVVALDGVGQGSGWSVNTTTGIITFTTAPGSGVEVSAGCQFEVPVGFGAGSDEALRIAIRSRTTRVVEGLFLEELPDEDPIEEEFFFGNARRAEISASETLSALDARVQALLPQSGSLAVKLPDPTALPAGFPYFQIINAQGTYTLAVKDEADATILTLATYGTCTAFIGKDASGNKWYCI